MTEVRLNTWRRLLSTLTGAPLSAWGARWDASSNPNLVSEGWANSIGVWCKNCICHTWYFTGNLVYYTLDQMLEGIDIFGFQDFSRFCNHLHIKRLIMVFVTCTGNAAQSLCLHQGHLYYLLYSDTVIVILRVGIISNVRWLVCIAFLVLFWNF